MEEKISDGLSKEVDQDLDKAMVKMVDDIGNYMKKTVGIKEQEDGTILFMSHSIFGDFIKNNMELTLRVFTTSVEKIVEEYLEK